jgi:hypothetical protein
MDIKNILQTRTMRDLAKYSSHPDFSKKNVAFTGSPKKHPYDTKKLILISDPFSSNTSFMEFKLADIIHIEELSSIVTEKGDNLSLVKIWVKKGSLGIRYEPFVVEDTLNYLRDTEIIFQVEPDE